ncbi:MAG: hypothetical protein Q4G59_05485 [Planctomycetia bacterium]|nr:hypothetical protein [Planctomycetia bacterium]
MSKGSTLSGSLAIIQRADGTGGDLSVDGTLYVNRNGEQVNVLQCVTQKASHTHQQTEESALWQIDHSLMTNFPKVKIFVGGQEVFARILYETATDTHIDICFVISCAGYAVLTT